MLPPLISLSSLSLHHHAYNPMFQPLTTTLVPSCALLSTLQTFIPITFSAWNIPESCPPPCPAFDWLGRAPESGLSLAITSSGIYVCPRAPNIYVRWPAVYHIVLLLSICLLVILEAQWGWLPACLIQSGMPCTQHSTCHGGQLLCAHNFLNEWKNEFVNISVGDIWITSLN